MAAVSVDFNRVVPLAFNIEELIQAKLTFSVVDDAGADFSVVHGCKSIGRNRFRLKRYHRILFECQPDHSDGTQS